MTTKSLSTIFSFIVIALMFASTNLFAQQNDRPLHPLDAADYECFQTIKCATESESLHKKGWVFIRDGSVENFLQELTITMNGKNVALSAIYNMEGNLVRAVYKRQNLALPAVLLSHLEEDVKEGWLMTATQMVVKDFNRDQSEYFVEMQNGNSVKKLRFSHDDIQEIKHASGRIAGN